MKCLVCEGWIISRNDMYCNTHKEQYGNALPWHVDVLDHRQFIQLLDGENK